jgi:hypothetical protein
MNVDLLIESLGFLFVKLWVRGLRSNYLSFNLLIRENLSVYILEAYYSIILFFLFLFNISLFLGYSIEFYIGLVTL